MSKKHEMSEKKFEELQELVRKLNKLTTSELNTVTEDYNKRAAKQFPWAFGIIFISCALVFAGFFILLGNNSIKIPFTVISILFIICTNTWLAFYLSKCPRCNKSFAKESKELTRTEQYSYSETGSDGNTYARTRYVKIFRQKCKHCGYEWAVFK